LWNVGFDFDERESAEIQNTCMRRIEIVGVRDNTYLNSILVALPDQLVALGTSGIEIGEDYFPHMLSKQDIEKFER